ncbi:Sec1 domain-containing protein 2 [Rhizoclosmatium sp. JEL0117]|nr:Sec1 domain-containing protein 2 [Rhizoclosmatium sp. JEL0117]
MDFVHRAAEQLLPDLKEAVVLVDEAMLQAQTRQLAASLITLLDALSVREEFFVLGETSRTLARCIISQSSTDTPRRNPTNPNNIAVLLMDRSLDLSVVAGRGDNLLDTIFRELESYEGLGPLDKKVDVSVYGSTYPYPLSIAHSVELDAMDFMKVVGSLSVKDGLVAVRKRVVDLMDPSKKPKVLGRVSVDQVEGFLKQCSWGKGGGVGKMGALCAAVVEAVKRDSQKELIKSVEKAVVGNVVEVYEGTSAVVPVMDFVATQQCPMEDVLALLTFAVSAMGPDMQTDADIRHRLRNVLLEGLGREQVDERKEMWIEEVLDRLEMIADTRSGMKQRGLIDPDTIPPYRSLLRHQLTKAFGTIADENKLVSADSDFQHIPYGGTLGNVLNKFSRLLGGAVPRIREYKRVLVFVVGGVTAQEVRDVREVGREFGVDVVIGGTAVATWKGVQSVLYPGVPGA